jgi:hypothetical protein
MTLRPEQAGFRTGRGCMEHILALRRVYEICDLYAGFSVVTVFIDFAKAFDSLDRLYMARALVEYGIPPYLIRAALSLYSNHTARVLAADGPSESFSVDHGVLQGDTLAPFLFVVVLDLALRKALDRDPSLMAHVGDDWGFRLRRRDGSRKPALYVTDMVYADDIALLAPSFAVAQQMLDAVIRETRLAGLRVNAAKTKFLVRGDLARSEGKLIVDGVSLERVNDFKYLGSYIGSTDRDIAERCNAASRAFGRLVPVWKAPLSVATKLLVFKVTVEPILLYGCETWALTKVRERSRVVGSV